MFTVPTFSIAEGMQSMRVVNHVIQEKNFSHTINMEETSHALNERQAI